MGHIEQQLKNLICERFNSVKEFSAIVNIPYTTVDSILKRGVEKANVVNIIKICTQLEIDTDAVASGRITPRQMKTGVEITLPEQNHIKKYRALDEHGKEMVDVVLDKEYKRVETTLPNVSHEEDSVVIFPTDYVLQSASVGFGDFNDDHIFDTLDLSKRPPKGTSFIIRISGDSMEPTYHDGDKLFIRRQDYMNAGQIGLFRRGSDLFVKEQGENCLISHNKKYDPVYPLVDTPIYTIGRVLGVCTDDFLQ